MANNSEVAKLAKAINDQALEPDQLLSELWRLSKGHRRKAKAYNNGTAEIYRTRTYNLLTRPQMVSNISYPPINKAKLQRANKEGQQVFYASAGMPTTLSESRVKPGQYIVFSRWVNTERMVLPEVGFDTATDGLERIYHDIFTTTDSSKYQFTSVVAEHLMGGDQLAGLMYPSISSQNKSANIVLKKSFVDNHMRCRYASLYHIKSIKGQQYNTEEIDFAKPNEAGRLIWKGRVRNWVLKNKGDELKMVSNGWDWNAYLSDGTYVEPE
jgi:hypothetical protein